MSKDNNTTIYRKGTSRSNRGIQDGGSFVKDIEATEFEDGIDWTENVKFPAIGIETEE